LGTSQKIFRPPGVSSWLQACFNLRRLGDLFGWLNPPKLPPVATGLNVVEYDLALLFTRDT